MIKFSIKFFLKKFKNSISYLTIMTILTSIEFTLFELSNHMLVNRMPQNEKMTFLMLIFIVSAFSFFVTFYVNNQFIDTLRKELAILSLSGQNLVQMSEFILVQCGVIFLISVPLGMFVGALILPLVHLFICSTFNYSYNIFAYNSTGVYEVLTVIITKIVYVIMIVSGFLYRNEIIDIINGNDKKKKQMEDEGKGFGFSMKTMFTTSALGLGTIGMSVKDRQKLVLKSYNMNLQESQKNAFKRQLQEKKSSKALVKALIFIVLYLMSFIGLKDFQGINIFYVYIGAIGLIGIVNYSLRIVLGRIHDCYLLKHSKAFIVANDVLLLLRDSITVIALITIGLPYLINLVNTKFSLPLYQLFVCFCYIVFVVILAGAAYFKNVITIKTRINDFKLFKVTGFQDCELRSIILKEVTYYYILTTICPIILIFIQMIQAMRLNTLDSMIGSIMIISYFVIFFISYVATYLTYQRTYRKGGNL